MKIKTQALSETFFTVDTYGQFSADYLDDNWFEESDFDGNGFMKDLAELHVEVIEHNMCGPIKGVKLIETYSPSYYNFSTDQAYLELDVDKEKLLAYLEYGVSKEFDEFLHEHFTSRDGFWSYTPNNIMDFNEVMDGTSKEYDSTEDHDKCLGILAGWYLTREAMTEEDYLDQMYDGMSEIMWNNFEQFTQETWDRYNEYVDLFNLELHQVQMFPNTLPRNQYPMEIEEWARERDEAKQLEEVNV